VSDPRTGDLPAYELPMRWADLDLLNHVTNVVYVDYAAEGQTLLRRDGHLADTAPVCGVEVTYLRPTPLSRRPLLLQARWDGSALTQDICTTADDADPVVHATVVTTHGDPRPGPIADLEQPPVDARMRMTDLDLTGHLSLAGQFLLAQEARIVHFARMGRERLGQFVVGRIALQPLAPMTWRTEPLQAHSWITRVGRGSFTIDTMVSGDDGPLFTSQTVLVGFDRDTQRSRPFADDEREHLEAHRR
jgi:acyl-CoA thioester hydrolase